jgi:hypothetical protein
MLNMVFRATPSYGVFFCLKINLARLRTLSGYLLEFFSVITLKNKEIGMIFLFDFSPPGL